MVPMKRVGEKELKGAASKAGLHVLHWVDLWVLKRQMKDVSCHVPVIPALRR